MSIRPALQRLNIKFLLSVLSVLGFVLSVVTKMVGEGFLDPSMQQFVVLGSFRVALFLAAVTVLVTLSTQVAEWVRNTIADEVVKVFDRELPSRIGSEKDREFGFRFNAQVYGMEYTRTGIDCEIHLEGTVTVTRHVQLLAHTHLKAFSIYLVLPESEKPGGLELVSIKTETKGVKLVKQGKPLWSLGRRAQTIRIHPAIGPKAVVNFRVIERCTKKVFVTPENRAHEKERKTPVEYVYWDIARPTGELSIRVELPPGMKARDIEATVLYAMAGTTTLQHYMEHQRVDGSVRTAWEGDHFTMALENISLPVLGLTYGIRWQPEFM